MSNLTSWKAYGCVLSISSIPLLALSASLWMGKTLSLASTILLILCYASLLPNYTIPFLTSPLHHLPEARPQSFFLAHAMAFFAQPPGSKFLEYIEMTPNTGMVRMRGLFHRRTTIMISSPEALKEILNDKPYDWEKPMPPRRFLERVVGNGVLVSEGQLHKVHRKSVAPAFHGSHIKKLMPLFWEKSQKLAHVLSQQLSTTEHGKREGVVDIHTYAPRATLDVMGVAGLGQDFNTLTNDDNVLAKAFAEITDTSNSSMVRYFIASMLLPEWLLLSLPWSMNKTFTRLTNTLRRACIELVQEKKVLTMEEGDGHVDILSILLRQSTPLTDETMTDQLLTFLAAGSETTSSTLVWAAYILSTYPVVQDQLRTEIQGHLQKQEIDGKLDLAELDTLPLLHAVCMETLRFYCAAPVTGRIAIKPTTILGMEIPENTEIIIAPLVINRSTSIWGHDAGIWKHERWLGEGNAQTGGASHPYGFLTFLHGPRSCIGQGFAKLELKFMVAAMIARFHMEMADKTEIIVPAGAVTVKPKNGLRLLLREC